MPTDSKSHSTVSLLQVSDVQLSLQSDSTEMAIAKTILLLPGFFVHSGYARTHKTMRRIYIPNKQVVDDILGKMAAVDRDDPRFVGELATIRSAVVFYKCPPDIISANALSYYGIDAVSYAAAFNDEIKVNNNIGQADRWITNFLLRSPFHIKTRLCRANLPSLAIA